MYFVVGDPHGCIYELREILQFWNRERDHLVLLGDLTDRGLYSLECLELAMELNKLGNVTVLGGNHEELFLEWLDIEGKEKGLDGYYYMSDFDNTIRSFFPNEPGVLYKYTKPKLADTLKELYPDILEFMRNRPLYLETENIIFAHAGISGNVDWKKTADKDCKWIRKEFIYGKNRTGKKVIFGHTLTKNIREDKKDDIWISDCGTKIGIDGGCVFGGQLNAVRLDPNGDLVDTYVVKNKSL